MVIPLSLGGVIRSLERDYRAHSEKPSQGSDEFSEFPKTELGFKIQSLARESQRFWDLGHDIEVLNSCISSSQIVIGIKGDYNGESVLVLSLNVAIMRSYIMADAVKLRILPLNHQLYVALKEAAEKRLTTCNNNPCSQLNVNHYQLSY